MATTLEVQTRLERVREAARALVAEHHMLVEDVEAGVEHAGRLWDFLHERRIG